jgi:hypothetical protein
MGAGHRHLEGDETRRADSAMAMKKARDFWRTAIVALAARFGMIVDSPAIRANRFTCSTSKCDSWPDARLGPGRGKVAITAFGRTKLHCVIR